MFANKFNPRSLKSNGSQAKTELLQVHIAVECGFIKPCFDTLAWKKETKTKREVQIIFKQKSDL